MQSEGSLDDLCSQRAAYVSHSCAVVAGVMLLAGQIDLVRETRSEEPN